MKRQEVIIGELKERKKQREDDALVRQVYLQQVQESRWENCRIFENTLICSESGNSEAEMSQEPITVNKPIEGMRGRGRGRGRGRVGNQNQVSESQAEMSQEPITVNKPRGRGRGLLGNQGSEYVAEMPQGPITMIRRSTRLNNAK